MGSKISARFGHPPQYVQQIDFNSNISLNSRSSVGIIIIDVELRSSYQNLNDLEDFDMNKLKTLSLNEEQPNVKICDDGKI